MRYWGYVCVLIGLTGNVAFGQEHVFRDYFAISSLDTRLGLNQLEGLIDIKEAFASDSMPGLRRLFGTEKLTGNEVYIEAADGSPYLVTYHFSFGIDSDIEEKLSIIETRYTLGTAEYKWDCSSAWQDDKYCRHRGYNCEDAQKGKCSIYLINYRDRKTGQYATKITWANDRLEETFYKKQQELQEKHEEKRRQDSLKQFESELP